MQRHPTVTHIACKHSLLLLGQNIIPSTLGLKPEDLKEKRVAKWELPDEDGDISNLMPGEERPDIEEMEKDGWVFSQKFDDLKITEDDTGDDVVVEFVK